ncbi:MAG: hypothetical protein KJ896_01735, partial [Nanoarchaeota archaeon]|nr:hypothetical protein [Nanoarchaeota archaeon]
LLDSEVEKLSTVDSGAPMSVLYDTAQKLGIARKYVDQALKIRQPTTEDVRELLKGYDVGQRKQDVGKRYGLELCNCMRETFPEQKENMPQGYDLKLTRHLMRPISVTYIDVSPEDISADAVHNVRRSAIDITLFCELADGCYDGGN